jgi:hypothetical protein
MSEQSARLEILRDAIACVDAVPTHHQLIGERKAKSLMEFKNDLKQALRGMGLAPEQDK